MLLGAGSESTTTTLLGWAAILSAIGTVIAAIVGAVRNRRQDRTEETVAERDDRRDDFNAVVAGLKELIAVERQAREDVEALFRQRFNAQEVRIEQLEAEVAECLAREKARAP